MDTMNEITRKLQAIYETWNDAPNGVVQYDEDLFRHGIGATLVDSVVDQMERNWVVNHLWESADWAESDWEQILQTMQMAWRKKVDRETEYEKDDSMRLIWGLEADTWLDD